MSIHEPLYGKICLLDADIVVHRSAAIAERSKYLVEFPDGTHAKYESHKEAKDRLAGSPEPSFIWTMKLDEGVDFALMVVDQTMQSLKEKAQPSEMKLYLTGKDNFRHAIAKTVPYKISRETVAKPKHFRAVREHLINVYGAKVVDGIEADDAIGIECTRIGSSSFVATIDKDMDQLAGWHFDWVKDRVYEVSKREADFNFYRQVLTGDRTDDIPGIGGIGPKTAGLILADAKSSRELFERVWDVYRTKSGKETPLEAWKYFREQSALVWILREELKGYRPPFNPLELKLGGGAKVA